MQDAPLLFAQRLIGAVTNAQRSGAIDIWLPTLAVKRSEPRPCVEPRAFLHRVRGRSSFDQFSTRFICVATGSCSVALNIRKLGLRTVRRFCQVRVLVPATRVIASSGLPSS